MMLDGQKVVVVRVVVVAIAFASANVAAADVAAAAAVVVVANLDLFLPMDTVRCAQINASIPTHIHTRLSFGPPKLALHS